MENNHLLGTITSTLLHIRQKVDLGWYSEPFDPDLLPGMYSYLVTMPIYAMPKPGSKKFCLVIMVLVSSAGQFALNNIISQEDIIGVALDNVQDLGCALCYLPQQQPDLARPASDMPQSPSKV